MRLKNVLIVVKDIEKSRKFYHDLFGIDLVLDNAGNMILTEGLVLQDEKIWKSFLGRDILPQNNACELYFEEQDIEAFVEKLERLYSQPQNALYVLYPHKINSKGKTVPLEEDEFKEKYPKAYNYILQFKDYLESKKVKYKTNPKYWYSLHRAREIRIFESEKIITPQLQNYGNFAIDRKKMYPDAGGYMLIIKDEYASDLYYYYGILNSSLFYHFITSTSAAFSNNYYYFKKAYIEPFHFPDSASEGIKQSIIDNVTSILNSRAENEEIDVSEYERNIDLLVYKLYGVTPDEQATIEEKYNVR